MTLGERIKEARDNHCISRQKLADIIGISYTMMKNIENDITQPKADLIVKICKELNLTTYQLLDYYGAHDEDYTYEERELIKSFRSLNEDNQILIKRIINNNEIRKAISVLLDPFI